MALITLVVAFTLGLALVESVGSSSVQKTSTIDAGNAEELAEAGIRYGYWLYRYRQQSLPIEDKEINLGSGTVSVSIDEYNAVSPLLPLPDTVMIESTATYNGVKAHLKRVVRERLRPFEMAFAVRGETNITNDFQIDAHGKRAVWTNGNLIINAPDKTIDVDGEVRAQQHIFMSPYGWDNVPIGTSHITYAWKIFFPPIEQEYYQARSSGTYNGGNIVFDHDGDVLRVPQGLTINGDVAVEGKGILLVNGDLVIRGNITYSDPDNDKLVVLTTHNIYLENGPKTLDGFYYLHNETIYSSDRALFSLPSNVAVTFRRGGLAADKVSLDGMLTIIADPDLQDTDLGARMHLPGYDMGSI